MKARLRTEPQPVCCLCGSVGTVLYRGLEDRLLGQADGTWTLKRCANWACGLLWLDPAPIEEDIGLAYVDYMTHGPGLRDAPVSAVRGFLRWIKGRSSAQALGRRWRQVSAAADQGYWARRYGYGRDSTSRGALVLGRVVSLCPMRGRRLDDEAGYLPAMPGGRLLDVGCGDGRLLRRLSAFGWRAEGVDPDPVAVERAAASGLEVRCGSVADQHYGEATFDAITQHHVIEHVHDPAGLLRECARILNPGGRLTVTTPNAESWAHGVFGAHYIGLDPPRHLYVFTRRALEGAVRRAGLTVVLSRTVVDVPWFCQGSYALSRGRSRITLWDWVVGYPLALIHSVVTWVQPERGECIVVVAEKEKTGG